jgi:hypothetical protein
MARRHGKFLFSVRWAAMRGRHESPAAMRANSAIAAVSSWGIIMVFTSGYRRLCRFADEL